MRERKKWTHRLCAALACRKLVHRGRTAVDHGRTGELKLSDEEEDEVDEDARRRGGAKVAVLVRSSSSRDAGRLVGTAAGARARCERRSEPPPSDDLACGRLELDEQRKERAASRASR
jgi:hypothetical protein